MKTICLLTEVHTSDEYVNPGLLAVKLTEKDFKELKWLTFQSSEFKERYKEKFGQQYSITKISVTPFMHMHFFDELPDDLYDKLEDIYNFNETVTVISEEDFETLLDCDSEHRYDAFKLIVSPEGFFSFDISPKHFSIDMWAEIVNINELYELLYHTESV